MSKSTVELDFFGLERMRGLSQLSLGIQNVLSRMNTARSSVLTGAGAKRPLTPSVPMFDPASPTAMSGIPRGTAPLTIFYNGAVNVFHVGQAEVEAVIRAAEEGNVKEGMLDELKGDLPMARKKSLQRFLEKRKERLTATAPFERDGGLMRKGKTEFQSL
ncbi:protein TIFY 9 [Asparagus officinalis]|uniref:protein TIFY 9 n=1 Tax=Asparagus officinalis TaxID=4686 RepID=UPI00098DFED5|nr:protein TIFY 9 [Asparagus officinalis]